MTKKKTTPKKIVPKKAPAKKKVVKLDEVVRLIRNKIALNFDTKVDGNDMTVSATWTPLSAQTKIEFKNQVQKEVIYLIAAAVLE